MALGFLLPLRILQALFSLIILGLSGYVAHWYDGDTLVPSPSQINFLLFLPIFSFISIVYLEVTPRFLSRASHPYAHMTFEVLNALFYFIGFVALATFLGKLLFCQGTVCHCARGADVFAAFSWILWTASSVLMGMDLFSDGFKSFKSAKTDEDARTAMKQEVKGPMRSTGIRLPERVHFQWRTQASGFAV